MSIKSAVSLGALVVTSIRMCLPILNKGLRSFSQSHHIKTQTLPYKMHNNSYVSKFVPARHSMLIDLADNILFTT